VTGVVLIPGVLALLPEYASLEDPVAELRETVLEAVSSLDGAVEVLADEQGRRVGEWALEFAGSRDGRRATPSASGGGTSYLVVGNGSARRSTEAPGYLDARAVAFDAELGHSLKEGLWDSLAAVDVDLAKQLWASVEGIVAMARIPDPGIGEVLYEDDPFGVQYWVMRWQCEP
jgi:hypothetical protein